MTFSPCRGPEDSPMLILGDSPTKKDIEAGYPFSGEGAIFFANLFNQISPIPFHDCRLMTALSFWPERGQATRIFHKKGEAQKNPDISLVHGQYVHKKVLADGKRIWTEIDRTKPKFILALGSVALWFLTGENKITSWRGSMLEIKRPWGVVRLLPTYHPSAVMKKKEWKHVLRHDLSRIDLYGDSWTPPDFDIHIHREFYNLIGHLDGLRCDLDKRPIHISCDVETRGGYITVLGLGLSATRAHVIPFTHFKEGNIWTADQEWEIMGRVKRILEHENAQVSGQNYHYDEQYLAKLYGINSNTKWDSMHMQHVFTTKNLPLTLDFLASLHCRHYEYWKDDGKDFHKGVKSEEDQQTYWRYNGLDCCRTFEVVESLLSSMDESWASEVYAFQQSMFKPVLQPMLRGIRFDRRKQISFLGEMRVLKDHYERWFSTLLPAGIVADKGAPWWNSPAKQKEIFYGRGGFNLDPIRKRQPDGRYTPTTDDAALTTLGKREPILAPLCTKLQEYRSINLFISLYLDSPPSPEDGRMRTNYDLAGTSTFRLASRKDAFGYGLNLQNITKG